jgi:hypothetical protein
MFIPRLLARCGDVGLKAILRSAGDRSSSSGQGGREGGGIRCCFHEAKAPRESVTSNVLTKRSHVTMTKVEVVTTETTCIKMIPRRYHKIKKTDVIGYIQART